MVWPGKCDLSYLFQGWGGLKVYSGSLVLQQVTELFGFRNPSQYVKALLYKDLQLFTEPVRLATANCPEKTRLSRVSLQPARV